MTNLCGLLIKDGRSQEAKAYYQKYIHDKGGSSMDDKVSYVDCLINISICDRETEN